jgi:hypothetical protein
VARGRSPASSTFRIVSSEVPAYERDHDWDEDICLDCGLLRKEEWTLDDQDRPIITLVWLSASGRVVRIRPFPYMLGVAPSGRPSLSAAAMFPGVEVGREPDCPRGPVDWDAEPSAMLGG